MAHKFLIAGGQGFKCDAACRTIMSLAGERHDRTLP